MGGACVLPPTPQSSCISTKPVGPGLDRMVSLKGGLRRVVIQQLRLLGIVGLPIPRYDLQNGTLQIQKQTASMFMELWEVNKVYQAKRKERPLFPKLHLNKFPNWSHSRNMFIQKLALNKESFIPSPSVSSGGRKASAGATVSRCTIASYWSRPRR